MICDENVLFVMIGLLSFETAILLVVMVRVFKQKGRSADVEATGSQNRRYVKPRQAEKKRIQLPSEDEYETEEQSEFEVKKKGRK